MVYLCGVPNACLGASCRPTLRRRRLGAAEIPYSSGVLTLPYTYVGFLVWRNTQTNDTLIACVSKLYGQVISFTKFEIFAVLDVCFFVYFHFKLSFCEVYLIKLVIRSTNFLFVQTKVQTFISYSYDVLQLVGILFK